MSGRLGTCLALLLLFPCYCGTATGAARTISLDVRVRILADAQPRRVSVTIASGSFSLRTSGDVQSRLLLPGESFEVSRARTVLRLATADGLSSLTSVHVAPLDSTSTLMVRIVEGKESISRSYDGALEVRLDDEAATTLLLVNYVPLESYVAAVVTSEYGLDDVEGAKAMAVLARTYAVKHVGAPGSKYDHVDHELSQVYRGLDGLSPRATTAAQSTKAEVVHFDGALAETVYHAESGGHTADNEAVWDGAPVEYLRGVKDPFANFSPYSAWQFDAGRRRLLGALSELVEGSVSGFVLEERSDDGRVSAVRLLVGKRVVFVSGNQFRLAVIREFGASALKSTLFDVSKRGESYRFTGSGFGHGVGVSQWGAHEMAKRGYSYDEIIAFYLRGTEVVRLPELVPSPSAMAALEIEASILQPSIVADPVSRPVANVASRKRPTRRKRIGW